MMYDVPCTLFIGVHLVYNRDSCIRVPVYHIIRTIECKPSRALRPQSPDFAMARPSFTNCSTHDIPSPRRHL